MDEIPDWWKPYAAQHRDWVVWNGVNNMLYARRLLSSPPLVLTGEDPQDLSDEITKREHRWMMYGSAWA